MAQLVNSSSGNFTTAATWNLVDTTSFLNSEAGSTNSPITFTNSSQFTPGAITIDGIGLKLVSRTTVSAATFSVRLVTGGGIAGTVSGTAVAGTTVTVNVSDLAINPVGWYFFKFASPVTLVAATAYNIQVMSTVVNHVVLYRDATASNWSRFLRTTTTQAPASTDNLIVIGDMLSAGSSTVQTVTMNNTAATVFGKMEISGNGLLSYGTSASTAYQLRLAGNLDIGGAGTLQIGTSGAQIPSTSSATLEFVVSSNVQFGLRLRGDGTLTTFGATKTGRAYLAADASATSTSLTTDVSTNWLTGDQVVVASTTRTTTETELISMTANASGTTLTSSALGFAHSGTNPTRAELANLTRNVKIFGQSITLQSFVFLANTNHSVSCNYTEFYFMGSGTANSRGIDINTTTGTCSFSGCSVRNFEVATSLGINIGQTAAANVTINDCVFYRCATNAINTASISGATVSITNCWGFVNSTAGTNIFAPNMNNGTFSNNVAVGSAGAGNGIVITAIDLVSSSVYSNLTAHSNGAAGIFISGTVALDTTKPTISNLITWRNNTRGVNLTNCTGLKFDSITSFGNTTSGLVSLGSTLNADLFFKNLVFNAGTTLTQPVGLEINGHTTNTFFEDCTFGSTTAHATGDISIAAARSYCNAYFRNCLFSSSTEIANLTNLLPESFIGSMSHDQVVGSNIAWTRSGVITKDNTIYDNTSTGTASTRLTPSSTTIKLRSPDKQVIVSSGKSLAISVKMRWSSTIFGDSANYNGNPTRLWLKKNPSIGINSDTLLATLTTSPLNPFGVFRTVTATTAVATDNGVMTFYVDCDGTAGWVNVDTWSCEII